jgi:SOS-response transcriptional repressor LexA
MSAASEGRVPPVGLTALQRDCLLVIEELTAAANGVAPSFDEIAWELGFSTKSAVARLVAALEARGWLARRRCSSRSLVVLHPLPLPIPDPPELALTASGVLMAQLLESTR